MHDALVATCESQLNRSHVNISFAAENTGKTEDLHMRHDAR